MNDDFNKVTAPSHRFVNGIVHDFVDQMMQGVDVCPAHIHAGAFAYCLKTLKGLNIACFLLPLRGYLTSHKVLP
jgi:hypothetical protein